MAKARDLRRLSERVGRTLLPRGLRLATAESCTGGWIAKAITDVPGSSQWFDAGYVVYSNAAKRTTLGVRARTLERHGAVSEAAVREMARGSIEVSGVDVAVAVSGVAGPDGGTREKPVGTVWLCWAYRRGRSIRLRVRKLRLRGDREAVRSESVKAALEGIIALVA